MGSGISAEGIGVLRRRGFAENPRYTCARPSVEIGFSAQGCVGEILLDRSFSTVDFDLLNSVPNDLVDFRPNLDGVGI